MGFEAAPPNGFRASLRSERRAKPVVAGKPRRFDAPAAGLGGIKVARSESRSSNERRGDRHRLSDEQAVVRRKGKHHVVELINLSHGGAMVAGDFKARLWDKVQLVLGDGGEGGEVECAVRWIRGNRIGLEFAHETRVDCDGATLEQLLRQVIRNSFPGVELRAPPTPEPEPEPPVQKRGDARHPLIWNGILHHDYEWEAVRLRNVSRLGSMIECPVSLPVGITVYLELAGIGRLGATVSWSRGTLTGLAFIEPFDVARLAKSKPQVASKDGSRPAFGGDGSSDQSPWARQWSRLSVDELGANLAG